MSLERFGKMQILIGLVLLAIGSIFTIILLQVGTKSYVLLFLMMVSLVVLLLLKQYLLDERFLMITIYALLAATFLNNAFFAINLGFFSMFPYRFLLIIVGFLIVFNLIRLEFRNDLWRNWQQVKVKGSLLFFVFWLYYAMLTLLWAKSVTDGIKYLSILIMGIFLLFIVTIFINDLRRITNFYYIWISMTVFLMLIGYWNYFTKNHLPSSTLFEGPEYKQHYPTSVFHNQNDYATFLSLSLFFFLSLIRNGKNVYWRAAGVGLSLISIHQIILTDSRASQLGALAGVGIYVFILCNKKIKRLLLLLGTLGTALFVLVFYSKIWETFTSLFLTPTVRDFSERLPSNEGRANLMRNAFHFTLESLGLGIGAGNAEYYMQNYLIHDTDGVVNIHFWFLEILTNFGIFVLLGYLTLYGYLLYKLYKYHQSQLALNYRLIVEAILVSLGAFVFSSISPSSVANLYFHWVLFAFALATLNILRKNHYKYAQSVSLTEGG